MIEKNAILISGKGATSYKANEIVKYNSEQDVLNAYGETDLYWSYLEAKRFGAEYVYLVNIREKSDHIDFLDVFNHYDFAYFAPTDIRLSDGFYDIVSGRNMTYSEDYANRLRDGIDTVIMFTDTHASLYEDIDSFLNDMKSKTTYLHQKCTRFETGRNISFVLNNLKLFQYANVVLAALLSSTNINEYPSSYDLGESVFDISPYDVKDLEMVYFKNRLNTASAPENLVNFSQPITAAKSVIVDRIIRYVSKQIDISKYIGLLYKNFLNTQVKSDVDKQLNSMVGFVLQSYKVKSVEFVKTGEFAGTIICRMDIMPIFSTESYSIVARG